MRRMRQYKRYRVGQLCIIGFFLVLLALVVGLIFEKPVCAQCTKGYKIIINNQDTVWVGDWTPYQVFPGGAPRGNNKYAGVTFWGTTQCAYNHELPATGWFGVTGNPPCGWGYTYQTTIVDTGQCPPPNWPGFLKVIYCYNFKDDNQSNHDYDCDGLPDSADTHPGEAENLAKNLGCLSGLCDMFAGNPANVVTGNKYEEVLDLTISAPGLPLEIRRSYNNQVSSDGPLGYGWTHNFDLSVQVLQETSPKRVIVGDSDGRALYFKENSPTTEIIFAGESGVKDRLKQVISTGEYFLRRKQVNLIYRFGSDGKLLTISDPNGNTLTLTYTGGLLTQVSDNFGKSLLIQYNTDNRISSITDQKNQSTLYEYTNGDLTKVTYPDQNFIRYAYSNHNLTDKYDTNNNLVGHWGYDAYGRVITYYSHVKDGVPQERIDLTFELGRTLVTRSTGTTTYNTAVIDEIDVVQQVDGCSTCGGVNKSFQYSNQLDLTDVTFNDGQQYTTHYVYDNPSDPRDKVGEILQMTEALGKPEAANNLLHLHPPHRRSVPSHAKHRNHKKCG